MLSNRPRQFAKLAAALVVAPIVMGADLGAAPPAAPSDLVFAASNANNQGTIGWTDNSSDELNFVIEFKFGSNPTFRELGNPPGADVTSFGVTGFIPGTPVVFRVRARNADGFSDYSNELPVITENYQIVASCLTLTPGDDFARVIETNFGEDVTLTSALPAWLSWDEETQTLSGVAAPSGIVKVTFSASSGVHSRERDFYVQVINEGPVVTEQPAAVELVDQPGALPPIVIDLASHFEDPDMGRAAAMNTPFGPINIGFYDDPVDGAPGTVANFFAYSEAGRWDGTFFHRSVQNFVIQGGGYVPDGVSEGAFARVEAFDAIANEYSAERPNICGTIAMAKLGGNPDSATSEWFFSIDDNVAILDPQNGGFTVFGRAAGMGVVDQISAFDTDTYRNITIDGSVASLSDWPLSAVSETSPLVSELASMSGVVEIPTLEFSVAGGDVAVATAVIDGGQLTVMPIGPGQVDFVVTATDLDGAEVSATWTVTISSSYPAWAEDQNLIGDESAPEENRDSGSLLNLQEYAFGGDPLVAVDDSKNSPVLVEFESGEGGDVYDAIMFRLRKFSSDLDYSVETSTNLQSWSELWTEGDPNDVLVSTDDDGDFWKITVRRIESKQAGGDRFFFRVRVSLVAPE